MHVVHLRSWGRWNRGVGCVLVVCQIEVVIVLQGVWLVLVIDRVVVLVGIHHESWVARWLDDQVVVQVGSHHVNVTMMRRLLSEWKDAWLCGVNSPEGD